jgi:hypothetical protein
MKQDDMRINGHYRANSGARVRVLQEARHGRFSGRRDHVRVKYVGGPRDGQEAKLASREILRVWTAQDDARAEARGTINKKVGAARVKLAMLGFDGEEMRVQARGDNTIGLFFHGDAAERVIAMLERASEEVA